MMLMPDDERPEPCIYTVLVLETPRFLFTGFSSRARLSARMSLPQSIDATVSMLIRIHDSAMGSFVSHTARRGSTYVPSSIDTLRTLADRGEVHHVYAAGLHRKKKKTTQLRRCTNRSGGR
jgi:hypothetical protein